MIVSRGFRSSFVALCFMGTAILAHAGISHTYDSTGIIAGNGYVSVKQVVIDAGGNVYMTGNFRGYAGTDGTTDLDPGPGVDNHTPQNSSNGDVYIKKMNADGSTAWTRTIGSATGYFDSLSIAVDSQGNVYIAGVYSGTVDFDPGPGTDIHNSTSGNNNSVLVKLHADGSYGWTLSNALAEAGGGFHTVTVDGNDDVYVSGSAQISSLDVQISGSKQLDFDPSAGIDMITIVGQPEGYVSKFHGDGSYAWTRVFSGHGTYASTNIPISQIIGVAASASGGIDVLGTINDTLYLDPGATSSLASPSNSKCAFSEFATRIKADGSYGGWVWALPADYTSFARDSKGNMYLTGPFQQNTQYNPFYCTGSGAGVSYTSIQGSAVLTKLNANGSYGWTKPFWSVPNDTTSRGVGEKVLVGRGDNAYVGGDSPVTAGGAVSSDPVFLSRATPAGLMSWIKNFGAGSIAGMAMDAADSIYVTGQFQSAADFDPGNTSDVKTPTGYAAVYLTKFIYTPNNIAPVAYDGVLSTNQNTAASGMLTASDADNDPLTYSIVSSGAKGTATITDTSTGAFTYKPATGKSGTDSFTFIVNDGQLDSNVASIAVTINPAPPGTDLVMSSISGPASSDPGKYVYISNTVNNTGADTAGSFSVGLYLSAESNITAADTYLGSRTVSSLLANASSTNNTRVLIPAGTPAGNYYIGAIADYLNTVSETNETNNAIATPFEITAPDLVLTALNGPGTPAAPATTVTVTGTVKNQGKAASPATYVGLYFSTDGTITAADTFLGYVPVAGLAINASTTFSKSVKLPGGLSAGTYYLGAIADYKNAAKESDESNNSRSTPVTIYIPTPDLTVITVSGSPTTVAQRGTLTLTGTIKNIGSGKSPTTSYAAFYLTGGVNDTFLKQIGVSALAAGASVNLSTTYTLPVGFAAGTYYVKLVADYKGAISEISEANNSLTGNMLAVLP